MMLTVWTSAWRWRRCDGGYGSTPLIRGRADRRDGQVLVVVAAAPDSDLAGTLTQDLGYGLAGRVQRAEAEPSMAYTDRVERLLSCCRTFPWGPGADRARHGDVQGGLCVREPGGWPSWAQRLQPRRP
jgi:hypothetical protein